MGADNTLQLVIDVDATGANRDIRSVNTSLSTMERQALSSAKGMGGGMDQMGVSMWQARGAAMMLEQEIGIKLPRAVNTMLARSELLGPVLMGAFNVAAFAAIGVAIFKAGEKLWEWATNAKEIKEQTKEFEETTKKYVEHVKTIRHEFELMGLGGVTKMTVELRQAEEKLQDAKKAAGEFGSELKKLQRQQQEQGAQTQQREAGGMYGLGIGGGLGAMFGVSDKDIEEAGKKYQAAQDRVREAEKVAWIDQGKIIENQERKKIELSLTSIDAQSKGKEIAALMVDIKKQELIKAEALANNYGLIAAISERNLVTDRLRLQILEDIKAGQKESLELMVAGQMEDWRKRTATGDKYKSEQEAEMARRSAEDLNAMETEYQFRKKMGEDIIVDQIKADSARAKMETEINAMGVGTNARERMMIAERKAALEADLGMTEIKNKYKLEELNLQKEIDALIRALPLDTELDQTTQDVIAAKRKQMADSRATEEGDVQKKATAEIWKAQQQEALTRINTIREAAGRVWDDLRSNSPNTWKNLLHDFENIFLVPVRMAFQHLAVYLFTGQRAQGAGVPAGGGGGGGFGGILGGIFAGGGGGGGGGGGWGTPPFAPSGNGGSAGGGGGLFGWLSGLRGSGGPPIIGSTGKMSQVIGGGEIEDMYGGTAKSGNTGFLGGLKPFGGKMGAFGESTAGSAVAGGLMMGGAMLAISGLRQGGWTGAAKTSGGGAMIGMALGGPEGAAIGAVFGFELGLIRMLFKGATEKAREKIKACYGVDIKDKGVLQQIVDMAKQGYGGNLDMAIRSQQVADLVRLYAMTTGQGTAGLPAQMTSSTLIQSGGGLYQQPTYSGGTIQPGVGGTLPGLPGTGLKAGAAGSSMTLNIKLDGPATTKIMQGEAVSTIVNNPRVVQSAATSATRSNYNRRELTALQLSPGTLTS